MDRDDIIELLQKKLRESEEDYECMLSNHDYDRGRIHVLEELLIELGSKSTGI